MACAVAGAVAGAAACVAGCASAPKPQAKQDDVPIRTPDEIARDQASSGPVADPEVCATRPNTLGCPANRGSGSGKKGPFDNSVQRNPRLIPAK